MRGLVAEADEQRRQALFMNPQPEDLRDDDVVSEVELNSDDEGAIRQGDGDGESDDENIMDRLWLAYVDVEQYRFYIKYSVFDCVN